MKHNLIDAKQAQAIECYSNPKSDTFGNITGSMRAVGYAPYYIKKVLSKKNRPNWLSVVTRKNVRRIKRAENRLDKILDAEIDFQHGDKLDLEKSKLQVDVAKYMTKNLAGNKYSGGDDESKNTGDVTINIVNYNDKPVPSSEPVDVQVEDKGYEGMSSKEEQALEE